LHGGPNAAGACGHDLLPTQDRTETKRGDRRLESLTLVRAALGRLRGAETVAELLNRATVELCRSCGFDRAVVFRVTDGEMIAESAHFEGDPQWAKDFVELARMVRPQLNELLIETDMIRHHRPVLVADPENDPRSFKPLVEAVKTRSYVAAPIMPNGRVIGMVHADRYMSGEDVDELDMEMIWTFAEGFGYAVDRTILVERLETETAHIQQMADTANALIAELRSADLVLGPSEHEANGGTNGKRERERFDRIPPEELEALLTRRELEVLELMASGASNAEIAQLLTIAVGTVKSHVKHILRKLRAANRAEAVSRYFRLTLVRG
jgi:LuxR family transcriptional regulator, regulator of acetate metabolism